MQLLAVETHLEVGNQQVVGKARQNGHLVLVAGTVERKTAVAGAIRTCIKIGTQLPPAVRQRSRIMETKVEYAIRMVEILSVR